MLLILAFAFLAGVITILSPCILPILPIILTSSIAGKNTGKSRPIGVVLGFILSFTFFTLFLSTIVQLSGISANSLRLVSVVVIAGFGATLLVPQFQVLTEKLFSKIVRFMPTGQNKTGFWGGILIGLSVGLLWTPCVGPILASVISLAITGTVTFDAFLITLAYSLGTAIPMFLIIVGGQNALRRVPWLLSNLAIIQKVFGIIMILTAIAIFFNFDRKFQTFVLNTFPQYGVGLTKFEDNPQVQNQLNKNNPNGQTIQKEDMGKSISDLLPKGPKAPEIKAGGEWFNSDPLTLAALKGKVVIIDFWTYSCINCQRTLPYLRSWNEKYKDKGLVIIGVHAPEFEFEKDAKNVAQALKDFKITYPVVQDNSFTNWRAYNNQYWPAKYFIDKDGLIRYTHFGEGSYDESEKVIQQLLQETGATGVNTTIHNPTYEVNAQSPETYLGSARVSYYYPSGSLSNGVFTYTLSPIISKNSFSLGGEWNITDEAAIASKNATLNYSFTASKVFLVLRPGTSTTAGRIHIMLDGKELDSSTAGADVKNGIVTVDTDRLYNLIDLSDSPGSHTILLEFQTQGIEAYAFTFG